MENKRNLHISYLHLDSWKELNSSDQELVRQAFSVSENAYAPYSNFQVGTALRLNDGKIVLGSNQENIAFPSGLCAERVALFHAGSNYPNELVNTLCVVAKGKFLDSERYLTPCGACRQVMIETEMRQKNNIRIILVSQSDKTIIFDKAIDLLPFAFGEF